MCQLLQRFGSGHDQQGFYFLWLLCIITPYHFNITCVSEVTSSWRILVRPDDSSFNKSASAQPVRLVKPAKTVNPISSSLRARHHANGDSQPVIKIAFPLAVIYRSSSNIHKANIKNTSRKWLCDAHIEKTSLQNGFQKKIIPWNSNINENQDNRYHTKTAKHFNPILDSDLSADNESQWWYVALSIYSFFRNFKVCAA